jgi:hypothetical protein
MAAKQHKNMFDGFAHAAEKREQEQAKITAAVTGAPAPKSGKTTITLSILTADKQRVKQYAIAHETTVSDLLHEWIEQHCI